MTKDGALFLVHFDKNPLTLAGVKEAMEERYAGITFNTDAINLEDGKIEIVGSILSPEHWEIVKTKGDKNIPFRITLLKDGSKMGESGKDSGNQLIKIAMYKDGSAVLEDLR